MVSRVIQDYRYVNGEKLNRFQEDYAISPTQQTLYSSAPARTSFKQFGVDAYRAPLQSIVQNKPVETMSYERGRNLHSSDSGTVNRSTFSPSLYSSDSGLAGRPMSPQSSSNARRSGWQPMSGFEYQRSPLSAPGRASSLGPKTVSRPRPRPRTTSAEAEVVLVPRPRPRSAYGDSSRSTAYVRQPTSQMQRVPTIIENGPFSVISPNIC